MHLHSQPPGFNAMLGVGLKLGGEPATTFALLFHGLGLATAIGLYRLLGLLGNDPVYAGVAVVLFAASPTVVLYENWLFNTHVVACGLVWGAVATHSLVAHRRLHDAVLLSAVVVAIACTRSLFHVAWVVALLGGTLWLVRRAAGKGMGMGMGMGKTVGRLALAMLPAVLLIVGLVAKNALMFGSPTTSTWLGMSLAKLTTQRLDPVLREELVASGSLSPTALVKPFSPLSEYPAHLVASPRAGHPALDRSVRPGNYTNFNHRAYVGLNRLYLDDALYVVRNHPGTWLRSMAMAWMRYSIPPSQYGFVVRNADAYAGVDHVYQLAAGVPEAIGSTFGLKREPPMLGDPGYLVGRIRWLYLAVLALAVCHAIARARRTSDEAERALLLYCLVNAAWVAVVANAVDLGENQRFHALVAPLHFTLIATALPAFFKRQAHEKRE